MEKIPDCQTCQWNFPPQGGIAGRLCANVHYGVLIEDIQSEKRECDDWKISFERFVGNISSTSNKR